MIGQGAVVADIADRSNIDALAAEIATPFGAPDIVIHATGINTCAMAEAWSPQGITTNAIGPGFFPTELTQAVFDDPDRAARKASQTCLGRNGTMEDMDGPILFLCSDASSYVTGQVLMVDGGFTAK